MTELNALYVKLLHFGMLMLREARSLPDDEWLDAEMEFLHNVPSLVDESNKERHRYFWFVEREHYLQWVSQHGSDRARSRAALFYEPLWQEMEPLLLNWWRQGTALDSPAAGKK